tara:strand:+ start:111 stop:356 length:246 start_codon:yes stop_codon:yes gene_type:complete
VKTKQQTITDGRQAERLLADTDLLRFLEEIEADCWSQFKATGTSDTDGREAVYMRLRGVDLVRQSLRGMVDNATIEIKRQK